MITLKLTDSEAKSLDLLIERTPHKDTQQCVVHNKLVQSLGSDAHFMARLEPNINLSSADVELILSLIKFVEQCDYNAPAQLAPLKQKLEVLKGG